MTTTIKKILSVFLILSLINGMFVFADGKFIANTSNVELKNLNTGKDLNDFSIGDILKTEKNTFSFDYNKILKIKLLENTEFKFDDFDEGSLSEGQISISSSPDYLLNISGLKIKMKNSGVFVKKSDSKINILSKYGINEIFFKGEKFYLLEGNKISLDLQKFSKNFSSSKNIFSQIEKVKFSEQKVLEKGKIFTEGKKDIFNVGGFSHSLFDDFIVFKNKKILNEDFSKKEIFNKCIDAIGKLTEKEKEGSKNTSRFYSAVKNKCLKDEIFKNKKFLEKFNKNVDNISVLKEKFLIDKMKKKFLGEKFSFLEKIFYLQQNISSADLKNFSFFLEESRKSLESEKNLKNLEIGFILIDGILKNNLKFSFNKVYDFREKISFKILKIFYKKGGEDLNFYTKKIISMDFNFIEKLLKNKNFKELNYIFINKPLFENPNNEDILAKTLISFDKKFKDYRGMLNTSKNILHGSALEKESFEKIKKIESGKKERFVVIKKMLDSFIPQKVPEVKITTEKQKIKIINIFKKQGLKVLPKNIKAFMEGGSLFYVNKVEFSGKKYDLVFDISREMVSEMKGKGFNGEGSMELYRFKNLISKKDYKVASFDANPLPALKDIEEKDFSQEIFLKTELVRRYLETVGIICDAENISNTDGENFSVKSAKIKKYPKLEISFDIKFLKWEVKNISFFEGLDSKIKINLAKNLKLSIEKVYGDYLLRQKNLKKILVDMAPLGIKKDDILLGKDLTDGFDIYKGFKMSSGNGILSGKYFVGQGVFVKARFTLGNHSEDFKNISIEDLAKRIKFINQNINDLEKTKHEEELSKIKEQERLEKIRLSTYGESVPDELLDGDWITN